MAGKLTAKGERTRTRIVKGAAAEIRGVRRSAPRPWTTSCSNRTSKDSCSTTSLAARKNCCWPSSNTRPIECSTSSNRQLSQLTSWRAWQAWRDALVERYRQQGTDCALAVVMTELGRSTPAARAVTRS